MAEYRAAEGYSKHQLDAFNVCPAYFQWKLKQEFKATREMELGTLIHSLFLEDRVDFAIAPEVDRRTKVGKAEWEAFCYDNPNKVVVTQDEGKRITASVEAARAQEYLIKGPRMIETSMFWQRGGLQCKGRPDMICEIGGKPAIVDLKTTSDISRFESKFFSLGYDKQAAWYVHGLRRVQEVDHDIDFWFLVVDTEAPHLSQWVQAGASVLSEADHYWDGLLHRFNWCLDEGKWPGLQPRTIESRSWRS